MRGFLSSIHLALTSPLPPIASALARQAMDGAWFVGEAAARERVAPATRVGVLRSPPERSADPATAARVLEPARVPPEPVGLRVVPYRPDETWPSARVVHPRVYDPFRAFPHRSVFLGELMYPRDPRD